MSSRPIVLSLFATLPFASAVVACSGVDGSVFDGSGNGATKTTPGSLSLAFGCKTLGPIR